MAANKIHLIKLHRIGYSVKGWTDNEIGVTWLKIFDAQTKAKVNGEWRLLLVDGHTSHYSLEFLEYARDNKIAVACYPSHTTHIYQGLDVVIFVVLKNRLSHERDLWHRKHAQDITKENFLAIYRRAHLDALTPDNILSAFHKTGIYPYDPSVVTQAMLAPSPTPPNPISQRRHPPL